MKKLWRYVKPFSYDTGTLRTDRQTDRRTDFLYQYRASVCWRAIKIVECTISSEQNVSNRPTLISLAILRRVKYGRFWFLSGRREMGAEIRELPENTGDLATLSKGGGRVKEAQPHSHRSVLQNQIVEIWFYDEDIGPTDVHSVFLTTELCSLESPLHGAMHHRTGNARRNKLMEYQVCLLSCLLHQHSGRSQVSLRL